MRRLRRLFALRPAFALARFSTFGRDGFSGAMRGDRLIPIIGAESAAAIIEDRRIIALSGSLFIAQNPSLLNVERGG